MAETHLQMLAQMLAAVADLATRTDRGSLERTDRWLAVGHALQLLAQSCIDLAQAVLRVEGLGVAPTYADTFPRLADAGLISPEDAVVLASLARLRNVLVHLYAEIDLDRLDAALHSDLSAVQRFRSAAARSLLTRAP